MDHSPAPWTAKALNFGEFEIVSGEDELALIYASDGMDEPEMRPAAANAAMMAASPDLLKAAEETVWFIENGRSLGFIPVAPSEPALKAAKAAIAKAKP